MSGAVVEDALAAVHVRQKGFFEGYSLLAILLVLSQAFHGLAVSAIYKYADVLIKNFASSMTMACLVFISAYLFSSQLTFHKVMGVASIIVTTYMYMNIAIKLPKPPQQPSLWKVLRNRLGSGYRAPL